MTLAEAIAKITELRDEARDGVDPAIKSGEIQMATINSARRFALDDALALLQKVGG